MLPRETLCRQSNKQICWTFLNLWVSLKPESCVLSVWTGLLVSFSCYVTPDVLPLKKDMFFYMMWVPICKNNLVPILPAKHRQHANSLMCLLKAWTQGNVSGVGFEAWGDLNHKARALASTLPSACWVSCLRPTEHEAGRVRVEHPVMSLTKNRLQQDQHAHLNTGWSREKICA